MMVLSRGVLATLMVMIAAALARPLRMGRLDLLHPSTDPASVLGRLDALEARVSALERRP